MSSLEKSLEKFKRSLEKGSFYEAQQLVKTVYYRLRSRKLLEESRDLLEEAACLQFEHKQVTCGTELAHLLVQTSEEDGLKADDTTLRRIYRILDTLEARSSSHPQEYESITRSAIKWVQVSLGPPDAVERLHARAAHYAWKRQHLKGLQLAMEHYCRSTDMHGLAEMLQQASKEFEEGEDELLAIRATVNVLNVCGASLPRRCNTADSLLHELQTQGCLRDDMVATHFLQLLLEALKRKSRELFALLLGEYSILLDRDPEIKRELAKTETIYCGAVPSASGLEGLFGGMLRSLMSAG